LKVKVLGTRLLLIENNKLVAGASIKNMVIGTVEKSKIILEVFKEHNEQLAALVGSEYSPATIRRYKISFGHTLSYIKWKYDLEDFEINKLNDDFLTDYAFWLKSVRKCNHNTTMQYIPISEKLSTVMNVK
jgi:hypothetical protein